MKKMQTVGRPPSPYPHSFARFTEDVQLGVADLNHTPLTPKNWRGRSPYSVWEEVVSVGWGPTTVDPMVIDAVLCNYETRVVGKECLEIGSKVYPVPGLRPGSRVSVARSWRRGADPLYRAHGSDAWILLAENFTFPANWEEGAKESAKLDKASLRVVRNLDRDAPEIDPMDVMRSRARKRVQGLMPKPGPAINPGSELSAVATAMRLAGPAAEEAVSEAGRLKRVRDATTRRLNSHGHWLRSSTPPSWLPCCHACHGCMRVESPVMSR